ncbi:hypothetical protein QQ054_22430 [Oscillatoria amoena NRMC-F 0135]|nr:hypothetical protein [Oscillatoria amoena NRMC-F 0135]
MIKCTKCSSEHVQSLPIVYQSGITGTVTQGKFSGTTFGSSSSGTFSTASSFGNYQQTSASQTNLSYYASPPIPYGFWLEAKLGLAAAYGLNMLFVFLNTTDTGFSLIVSLIISPLFSVMALFRDGYSEFRILAIMSLAAWFIVPMLFMRFLPSAKRKKAWNQNQYPVLYEQWSKSFFCNTCGNIFIPTHNSLRDTEGIVTTGN